MRSHDPFDEDGHTTPKDAAHNRSRSHELEDHMAGSVYSPWERCPHCMCPRMSSVYCSVAHIHHGTDEVEPRSKGKKVAKTPSRADIQHPRTASSNSEPASAEPTPQPQQPTDESSGGSSSPPKAAATSGGGWSLFKSKEEKEMGDLKAQQMDARKKISESAKSEFAAIEKDAREEEKTLGRAAKRLTKLTSELEDEWKKGHEALKKEARKVTEGIEADAKKSHDAIKKAEKK